MFKDIASARFLPDGGIVIADAGLLEIRLFRRDGVYRIGVGRSGEGPGEFKSIGGLWITPEGQIAVWDSRLMRISLFNGEGELESTHQVRGPEAVGNLDIFVGHFSNGDLALGALRFGHPGSERQAPVADHVVYGRFTLGGAFEGLLGEADGLWRYQGKPLAFSTAPYAVLSRDRLFVADSYDAEISVRDGQGRDIGALKVPVVEQGSSSRIWSQLEARLREDNKTLQLQYLGSMPKDERIPQIAGLLTDADSNLWVKVYDPLRDSIWLKTINALLPQPGGAWRVMRADGQMIATVKMPADVRPMEIRGDRLLGVARDDLGVERVVIHAIHR